MFSIAVFCSIQAFNSWNDAHLHEGGNLLSSLISFRTPSQTYPEIFFNLSTLWPVNIDIKLTIALSHLIVEWIQ